MADYKIGDKIRANPDTLAHFNADYTGAVEAFEGKNTIMVRMDRTKKLVPFGAEQMTKIRTPKALDAMADKVLRYRPKPKTTPARRRKRAAAKREKPSVKGFHAQ